MQNKEEMSIASLRDLIEISVEKFADKKAVSLMNDETLTYKQYGNRIKKVAQYLLQQGITKGDKVAILGDNSPNWGVAYLSAATIGAIAVPILPDFQPSAIDNILEHSTAKMVFVSKKLYKNIPEKYINKGYQIIILNNLSIVPKSVKHDELKIDNYNTITNVLQSVESDSLDFSNIAISENDIASIIYTSGTTGSSKGVMLSHKNLISNVHSCYEVQNIDSNDRFLSILPLSHTYENTLGFLFPIKNGASIYYLGKMPTANVLIGAMQKVKPTLMLSVPLIIEKIFRQSVQKKFTSNGFIKTLYGIPSVKKFLHKLAGKKLMKTFGGELKFFGVGGAALSPDVEQFLIDAKFPYAIGYGLTETSPLLAGANPAKSKYRSTGPAVDLVELKIDNPDKNGEGEILAKGPNIMLGYYKNEEKTKETFTEDGWFKTGDLGVIDENNYLFIKGRSKNMILGPNGENIYPEEIEAALNKYKYVVDSLVFETKGKLSAKIHLNFEELEEQFQNLKDSAVNAQDKANEILEEIKLKVNAELNKFSKLNYVMIQIEPFEKTPTKKIKRYLYI
ncbi:MAG: long-chain fatty acid--CoA ligase [Chlorobi bacterium]|nr:long-chain fatty acid--CoA ligase [Chlorobiota bacterium]